MPGLNGLEAPARITKECPKVRVLILSRHDSEEYIWRAMRAGASVTFLKGLRSRNWAPRWNGW